ncbi:MAG: pantoate--beta-alanine ligase [Solirubrobacterales bacterium]
MNSNLLADTPRPNVAAPALRAKADLRAALADARRGGQTIGLVPTMGYLHEGHLSLIRAARAECGLVVLSLFVNPTQFGAGEDLDRYPRDEERDLRLAGEAGAGLVFAPAVEEVYPGGLGGPTTEVEVIGPLTSVLDGDPQRRGPEHFRGVATVVAKLFNIVGPDVAYFGQKDAQQALVIRRMVRDLDFPLRIEVLPTIREADGLAMSSRNAYLGPEEREQATALSRALAAAERGARAGSLEVGLKAARRELAAAGIEPEYLEARDGETLESARVLEDRPVLVALAARVGSARLIDNVLIHPHPGSDT